jgi:hypothetical protein
VNMMNFNISIQRAHPTNLRRQHTPDATDEESQPNHLVSCNLQPLKDIS